MTSTVTAQLPIATRRASTPAVQKTSPVHIREHAGDKVEILSRDEQGAIRSSSDAQQGDWWPTLKAKAYDSLVPANPQENVSQDYAVTRKWQLARDFFGSMGGTASLAAVLTAMVPAQSALAALSVAGLTVANVGWVKDRLSQFTSFVSGNVFRDQAEKNPRPWIMAADVVNNVGTVVDASTALLPPLAYYPLQIGMTLARAVGGSADGVAQAGIPSRQAIANNLGEVASKNSNQAAVATFLGSTAGIGALAALGGTIGFAPAAFAIAATASAGGLLCTVNKLKNLDYHPVNEKAIRAVVAGKAETGEAPAPDRSILRAMGTMLENDRLIAGQPSRPLLETSNFESLRELYSSSPYILGVVDGAPYIVLKDDLQEPQDSLESADGLSLMPDFGRRMAQMKAVYQGVVAESLLAGPEFAKVKSEKGLDEANLWVAKESLRQTPQSMRPLLEELKAKGWSADLLAFSGDNRLTEISSQAFPEQPTVSK